MRNITVLMALASISSPAFSGGTIGGSGGLGALNEVVMDVMGAPLNQPDLGLEEMPIAASDFRRARSRLDANGVSDIIYEGETVSLMKKSGGIVDIEGKRQLVPVVLK
jgi:hypothetical protein